MFGGDTHQRALASTRPGPAGGAPLPEPPPGLRARLPSVSRSQHPSLCLGSRPAPRTSPSHVRLRLRAGGSPGGTGTCTSRPSRGARGLAFGARRGGPIRSRPTYTRPAQQAPPARREAAASRAACRSPGRQTLCEVRGAQTGSGRTQPDSRRLRAPRPSPPPGRAPRPPHGARGAAPADGREQTWGRRPQSRVTGPGTWRWVLPRPAARPSVRPAGPTLAAPTQQSGRQTRLGTSVTDTRTRVWPPSRTPCRPRLSRWGCQERGCSSPAGFKGRPAEPGAFFAGSHGVRSPPRSAGPPCGTRRVTLQVSGMRPTCVSSCRGTRGPAASLALSQQVRRRGQAAGAFAAPPPPCGRGCGQQTGRRPP